MKRDLKRFYRQHGIRLFALPLVVVLLLAVLADQRLGSYLEHREEAADLQAQRERQREILRLDAKVRRSNEALSASHASAAARIYTQPDAGAAQAALQSDLGALLRSLYMENVEFFEPLATAKGAASRIEVSARFTAVPQQLPRLQSALASAPRLAQVQLLELRVEPDPARGSQQLAVVARFAAVQAAPLPEPEEQAGAANSSARSAKP